MRIHLLITLALAGSDATELLANSAAPSALDTPAQIAAEKRALQFLADPQVKAEQAKLRAELAATPVGQTQEGAAQLDRAIAEWTSSYVIGEIAGDPAKPQILWNIDDTPHSWHGHSLAMAVAGDNPDHIYRITSIDGAGRYEIIGQIDTARRPAQFSFESIRKKADLRQTASSPDMGGQVQMLTDREIEVKPDGSFRLTVGGPGDEPNHLRTEAVATTIAFRDVLSDWNQHPNRLSIRRLDVPTAHRTDAAALRQHLLDGLPDYVRFWAHFTDKWFGGLKPNVPVGPVARDGNWGYLAAARYVLRSDEAVVITTTRGGARYTGIQVTDAWAIAPDSSKHQASLNVSQAVANPDGSYSYVLAPQDPGIANWIDTAGIHDGYVLMRWQGFEAGSAGTALLRDYRVVKFSDLKAVLPVTTRFVSRAARARAIAARAAAYKKRIE
ncbi:hypothetical protein [Novosphingobium sp. FKTRR1]|uniref:hypothetical protein n=1 Tax=Novosphingobium sp. FKTRR1 TaxID=2879118 RepID=UPI001CF051DB|nr:hypothetical protein [Novosphingobium sp. FKTRR1]